MSSQKPQTNMVENILILVLLVVIGLTILSILAEPLTQVIQGALDFLYTSAN